MLVSLFVFAATAFALSDPDPLTEERIRALIVDGQNNHNWRATTPILEKCLEQTGHFEVDVATSPGGEAFAKFRPDFKKYDVIVSNYNGKRWSADTCTDFVDYMVNGGGLVVVHAADNAFPGWPEWNEMIAVGGWGGRNEKSGPYLRLREGKWIHDRSKGRGGSHGRQHEFVIELQAPQHPIVRGLPLRFKHTRDELYDRLRGPARNVTVLASAFSDPKTRGSGEHEPLLMAIGYGKGRVFHTALGHSPIAMNGVGFRVTLTRGTEWAATGEVTLNSIPHDFPTEARATHWSLPSKPDAEGRVRLFNGKSLAGWKRLGGMAEYSFEGDDTIVGKIADGARNTWLCTENLYGDFELTFDVKLSDARLNSGVQVRTNSFRNHKNGTVHGYQVEITATEQAGLIYDENRRGWLSPPDSRKGRKVFRDTDWNQYRVVCRGGSIKTWVNGEPVADVVDSMTAAGFIGLQMHGVPRGAGPYEARWRNLILKEL